MKIQVLQGRLGRTVSLRLKTKNGSAIGEILIHHIVFKYIFSSASQDYRSVDTNINLNSSVSEVNVNIPIVVDELVEYDEIFSVELSLISPSTRVSIAPANTLVTIKDDSSTKLCICTFHYCQ